MFQLAKDIHITCSPLLLNNFAAFEKTKNMNTDLFLRILFYSSKIGISLARPLRASQNVDNIPIHNIFNDNPTIFGKSLTMIKQSNINFLHQCTSADGSVLLPYRDAIQRNSTSKPGTIIPRWYQHIINTVTCTNSWRLLSDYIRSPTSTVAVLPSAALSSTLITPLQRVSVPERNIRAGFWCAVWHTTTNSPIIGKAIYTAPTVLRFQHWIPIINTNDSSLPLTPTSRKLQLEECNGCSIHNDSIDHRRANAASYLDQFPCRIACKHNDAVKLIMRPTTTFTREKPLDFNTTLANLTSDIRASFSLATNATQVSHQHHQYERGTVQLSFLHNNTAHDFTSDTRTTKKTVF